MVSSEDIRVRMAIRPKTRLAVGVPGMLSKFTAKDVSETQQIKVPFRGENVVMTKVDGEQIKLEGDRLATVPFVPTPVISETTTNTPSQPETVKESVIDKLKKVVTKTKTVKKAKKK